MFSRIIDPRIKGEGSAVGLLGWAPNTSQAALASSISMSDSCSHRSCHLPWWCRWGLLIFRLCLPKTKLCSFLKVLIQMCLLSETFPSPSTHHTLLMAELITPSAAFPETLVYKDSHLLITLCYIASQVPSTLWSPRIQRPCLREYRWLKMDSVARDCEELWLYYIQHIKELVWSRWQRRGVGHLLPKSRWWHTENVEWEAPSNSSTKTVE